MMQGLSSEAREGERRGAAEITRDEDALRDTQDEADKKRLAADIERLKGGLASFKTMEQDRITVLQQAEAQLDRRHKTRSMAYRMN